jgi:flagellar basal-body rod protein FlgB
VVIMAINFDKAFGMHQYTVGVRAKRAEVLANNIVNADTPGFKAQDLDFKAALQSAHSKYGISMSQTHSGHKFGASASQSGLGLQFRVSNQPDAGDGNSVDADVERTQFMRNSMEYQASLDFLNSKISNLRKAIKGQ